MEIERTGRLADSRLLRRRPPTARGGHSCREFDAYRVPSIYRHRQMRPVQAMSFHKRRRPLRPFRRSAYRKPTLSPQSASQSPTDSVGRLSLRASVSLLQLLRGRRAPSVRIVNDVRRSEKGEGWRKPWVEFDGASQQARRFAVGVSGSPKPQFSPAQEAVIGFLIVGVLRCDALPVARAEIERESGGDQVLVPSRVVLELVTRLRAASGYPIMRRGQ